MQYFFDPNPIKMRNRKKMYSISDNICYLMSWQYFLVLITVLRLWRCHSVAVIFLRLPHSFILGGGNKKQNNKNHGIGTPLHSVWERRCRSRQQILDVCIRLPNRQRMWFNRTPANLLHYAQFPLIYAQCSPQQQKPKIVRIWPIKKTWPIAFYRWSARFYIAIPWPPHHRLYAPHVFTNTWDRSDIWI